MEQELGASLLIEREPDLKLRVFAEKFLKVREELFDGDGSIGLGVP